MSDITFNCPRCQQKFIAPGEMSGQTIACTSCNGAIELPKLTQEAEGIHDTVSPLKIVHKNRSSGERKASPKQRALLAYLGIENAEEINAQEANRLLDEYYDAAEPFRVFHLIRLLKKDRYLAWPWVRQRIRERLESWRVDRLVLHPRIYQDELFAMLEQPLRSHVRSEIVGASEKLVRERVCEVVLALSDRNPRWWQSAPFCRNSEFYELLREMYPGCCDGKKPSRKGSGAETDMPILPRQPGLRSVGRGCCVVLAAFVFVLVILAIVK